MGTSSSPPSSAGLVPDLATCRLMSVNEKRELVHGLSKFHHSAPEQLQDWSRREIIEVLCAELGKKQKERTYSSMAKHKLLDFLFRVVKGESSYPRNHKEIKSIPDLKAITEKRELVRELSYCQQSACEQLKEWTRREILEVLCAELGRERKERTFSSIPKHKLLDLLFKAVNGESFRTWERKKKKSIPGPKATNFPFPLKRQRKNDSSASLPVMSGTGVNALANNAHRCQNSACGATLGPKDKFCKSCSCCICLKYDENKDPTLWLFCADQPVQEDSCGFSCHLECALEDERSGIRQSEHLKKLDGDYYCTQCGKQNDLLGCWKKQLWIAKDSQQLDVLRHRIFLSHKILISTERYLVLHKIVEKAMTKLDDELGPNTGTLDMGHGLVCRFAVREEVQKLCISALESLQSLFSGSLTADLRVQRSFITHCSEPISNPRNVKHVDIEETGIGGLEKLSRATATISNNEELTRSDANTAQLMKSSSLMAYNRGNLKQNLERFFVASEAVTLADTGNMLVTPREYSDSLLHILARGTVNSKEIAEKSSKKEAKDEDHVSLNGCIKTEISQESLSCTTIWGGFDEGMDKDEPSEPKVNASSLSPRKSTNLILKNGGTLQTLNAGAARLEKTSDTRTELGNEVTLGNEITATSFKPENDCHIHQSVPPKLETELRISSDKSLLGKYDETSHKNGRSEASYEYCVKVVRRLECEGYICSSFRLNFLTWFCLRSTPHERKTVTVFVDTLIDDPASLGDQLRDTFSDAIYGKGAPQGPFLFGVELKR